MGHKSTIIVTTSLLLLFCLSHALASDRPAADPGHHQPLSKPAQGVANVDLKTHDVGNVWLSVTNYGQFGSGDGTAPSCEFPANSDIEYLFYGGIWIGALVEGDTMVSVATDGWLEGSPGGVREAFWPGWEEEDTILVSSTRVGTPEFDSAAVSEQDFIASYTDTSVIMAAMRDFPDHKPMGIRITQKSYAWSYSYAEDFILFDFEIQNITDALGTPKTFEELYMGVYIDGDVGHKSISGYFTDDITGFMRVSPEGDTVNIAWIKDNDSDEGLTPGVSGCCPLYPPPEVVSYNWWDPPQDWGPTDPNNPNDYGHTPEIPAQQYRVMSNGYLDPDQTESNPPSGIDPSGMDTRYLLSYGPYTVPPGRTLVLTMGYVCGQPEPGDTDPPFDDLGRNARWARDVYDNPGVDTDPDDDIPPPPPWRGDGVPDFKGPPPPPSPSIEVMPGDRKVTLRWDNSPEEYEDSFSHIKDFEGYRVYRSRTGILGDFQLLGEYDRIDGFGYDFGFGDLNPDTLETEGDTIVWYTFIDEGLTNGELLYYAVTAYDSGYAPTGLDPLESSPIINMTRVAPSAGPDTWQDERSEIVVVPNPYRIDGNYYGLNWESGTGDWDKRIDFLNLPTHCTIRIFTLAGDMVDTIEHDYPSRSSVAHQESWDMVTRNNQAIASGIYIFTVESEGKRYIGKFVVIK